MSARRTLVALLRGINVGGRNSVPMAGLRSVLEDMGLEDVTTYIQSGNVVFRSEAHVKSLPAKMEDAIADAFGVRPAVLLRTPAELAKVAESNPFEDTAKVHVVLLARRPTCSSSSAASSTCTSGTARGGRSSPATTWSGRSAFAAPSATGTPS